MTPKELKKKIDGLFLGLHSTNPGDNNVLPEILNALAPVEVTDITAIPSDVLDALQPGQSVVKITGKQRHTYTVTYKGEGVGEGICISYFDASLIETVSYDFTADGWVYNSTDKWEKA